MKNIDTDALRKNLFDILEQVIKHKESVSVNTKDGKAIIISEDNYNQMMETFYLLSDPEIFDRIKETEKTPLSECIPEDKVKW